MNNSGWSLNSLLAGLGILTFALVFAVILYDAKIRDLSERFSDTSIMEKNIEKTYSYKDIEEDLVEASKTYVKEEYGRHIPEGSMRITMDTLIERGLYKQAYDPKDKGQKCLGYVIVDIEDATSKYSPYIKCGKYYESSKDK